MDRVTYQDLVTRFGNPMAFDLLLTIEKLARVKYDAHQFDENIRLQKALDALNEPDSADNINSCEGAA